MPNTEVFLSGKCTHNWLVTPDTKFDAMGKWTIVLYPDPPSLAIINELKERKNGVEGIMNHLKKDEEGYYMTFTRPTQRIFKGLPKAFTPPILLNADNTPASNLTRLGHGSDVTLKVEVRTYPIKATGGTGRATRLVTVRVDNLVPFESSDFTEAEAKQASGMKDVLARAPF